MLRRVARLLCVLGFLSLAPSAVGLASASSGSPLLDRIHSGIPLEFPIKTPPVGTPTFAIKMTPTAPRLAQPTPTSQAPTEPTATPGLGAPAVLEGEVIVDTYINEWDPDANVGGFGDLRLRFGTSGAVKQTLIYFEYDDLPVDAQVTRALLRLHSGSDPRGALVVGAYGVIRDWEEEQATWQRCSLDEGWKVPGASCTETDRAQQPVDTQLVDGSSSTVEWDITQLVQHWVSQDPSDDPALANVSGNNGVILVPEPGNVYCEYGFYSTEYRGIAGVQPQFVIEYTTGTEQPTPTDTVEPTSTPTDPFSPGPDGTPTPTVPLGQPVIASGSIEADTYVSEWEPETSYGGAGHMRVRNHETGSVRRALIRFSLDDLPDGCLVQSASLVLTTTSARCAPLDVGIYGLTSDWSESCCSWQVRAPDQPWAACGADDVALDRAASTVDIQRVDTPESTFGWDITKLVRHWVSGSSNSDDPSLDGIKGNCGLALLAMTGSQAGECCFYSHEYVSLPDVQPNVLIAYTMPTPTPTATATETPAPTATPEPSATLQAPAAHLLSLPFICWKD